MFVCCVGQISKGKQNRPKGCDLGAFRVFLRKGRKVNSWLTIILWCQDGEKQLSEVEHVHVETEHGALEEKKSKG